MRKDESRIRTAWCAAVRIPQKLADLERILGSEYAALVSDLNSPHWVIRDEGRKPWGVLKFQKLYTLTFDDNDYPLQGLLHLGFKVEGRLRRHFYDPAKRAFVDVIQASMLAEEAFSASNRRVMKRLRFNQV